MEPWRLGCRYNSTSSNWQVNALVCSANAPGSLHNRANIRLTFTGMAYMDGEGFDGDNGAHSDDIKGHGEKDDWKTYYHLLLEDDFPKQVSYRRFKKRPLQPYSSLQNYEEEPIRNKRGRGVKILALKKRGQWSNRALKAFFQALDNGYKIQEVSQKYGIPRSSRRENYLGKRKSRKFGAIAILTMVEKAKLVVYMEDMVKISCLLNTTQLRLKVVEIT